MPGKRIFLNSILTAIAIFLLGLAVRVTWLPPTAYGPKSESAIAPTPKPSLPADTLSPSTQEVAGINQATLQADVVTPEIADTRTPEAPPLKTPRAVTIKEAQPEKMLHNQPYKAEASKVLSGRLEVTDSIRRRSILNYCEHFRMAYDTKDIDFLRQVFSEDALIIVGRVVKTSKSPSAGVEGNGKVRYTVQSRRTYLDRLAAIFNANKKIKVGFSDFHIMRHPTKEGIYGVTLLQKYESDLYSDEGYIFLLWDFRNESMPLIHVRTWQPLKALRDGEEPIDISDFNLE